MPGTDPSPQSALKPAVIRALEDLAEERLVMPLATRGIATTPAARDLFVRTLIAQVEGGIVPAGAILAVVRGLDLAGLADFHLMKFGPRPLSYNRMIRLLADMHDRWIRTRVPRPGSGPQA